MCSFAYWCDVGQRNSWDLCMQMNQQDMYAWRKILDVVLFCHRIPTGKEAPGMYA
jgi:hypothetical protein